jgi:hypothetical protein
MGKNLIPIDCRNELIPMIFIAIRANSLLDWFGASGLTPWKNADEEDSAIHPIAARRPFLGVRKS